MRKREGEREGGRGEREREGGGRERKREREWNGICFLGQRPSAGTSEVIQLRQKERKKK